MESFTSKDTLRRIVDLWILLSDSCEGAQDRSVHGGRELFAMLVLRLCAFRVGREVRAGRIGVVV